jgi:hypothetical protein
MGGAANLASAADRQVIAKVLGTRIACKWRPFCPVHELVFVCAQASPLHRATGAGCGRVCAQLDGGS